MRWLWRALAVAGLLVVVAAIGGWLWLRQGLPSFDGTRTVAGLHAPVQVMRDAHAIPHIFAATDADAFFTLGYLHAGDRLLQMEMQRRVGAGRVSELIGAGGVRLDRFMRTLGLYRQTAAGYDALPVEVRTVIEAYAAGVNAWLEEGHVLPPAFAALGHRPEPWTPADSLIWARLIALQLSGNFRGELLRARIVEALGTEAIADLFPEIGSPPTTLGAVQPPGLARHLAAVLPPPLGPDQASNEWVVSGEHTADGLPILANDPHLALNTPVLWYLARIETPTLSLVGATVPGVPMMVLGHNGSVAWGFTTTGADVQDLFIERIDPDDPTRYLTPTGSEPFAVREETLVVNRSGDTETLLIRETRHGPVLTGIDPEFEERMGDLVPDGHVLALAYTGWTEEDTAARAIHGLNRAETVADAVAALSDWIVPVQNVVLADTGGNIGFMTVGRIPIRRGHDGALPVPGWTGDHDWIGRIVGEEMPLAVNPPDGRLVNANNTVVGADYPLFLGHGYEEAFRARRIEALLAQRRDHTVDIMADIMLDTGSLAAATLWPYTVQQVRVDTPQAADILAALRRWDFAMDRERPEPLLYMTWMMALTEAVFADELGPALFADYGRLRPSTLIHVLSEAPVWCDDVGTDDVTETCAEILRGSLMDSLAALIEAYGEAFEDWAWGDAHVAPLAHRVYGRVPLIGGLFANPIATDGGEFTVNRGGMSQSGGREAFQHVHGAGLRAIYPLSDLAASRFMIATGQSGNPLSAHYSDLVEAWRDGDWITLSGTPGDLADTDARSMTLRPVH